MLKNIFSSIFLFAACAASTFSYAQFRIPTPEELLVWGSLYAPHLTYDDAAGVSRLTGTAKESISSSAINTWIASNNRSATEIVLDRVNARMDSYPIKVGGGQNIFSQKLSTDYDRCSRKKFSLNGDIDVMLTGDELIHAFFDSLQDPYVFSFSIDGTYDAHANLKLKPSKKIVGKCVRLGKESVSLSVKPIPMDFLAQVVVSLNPYLIKPEDSGSGNYEVFIRPSASITFRADPVRLFQTFGSGDLQQYYPNMPTANDIAKEIVKNGDLDALVGVISVGLGDFLGGKLGLDLGWLTSGGSVESFVQSKVLEAAKQAFTNVAVKEIVYNVEPSQLGGSYYYVLPSANDIYANNLVNKALTTFGVPGINCFGQSDSQIIFADMLYAPNLPTIASAVCADGVMTSLVSRSMM